MAETLKLTPSESVTIREDTPAALEVEGRWGAGGGPPPRHFHPSWFRAIDALHRSGRVGSNGMPGPLAFAVMLTEYRDVFRLAGPDILLRPAFAALGVIGRRGYRATG